MIFLRSCQSSAVSYADNGSRSLGVKGKNSCLPYQVGEIFQVKRRRAQKAREAGKNRRLNTDRCKPANSLYF
jgi:hypothetical protein